MKDFLRKINFLFKAAYSPALAVFFLLIAVVSRFLPRKIDVGLGPEPLINNVYHKKALIKYGYSAETFVFNTYFITDEFDVNISSVHQNKVFQVIYYYYFLATSFFRYKSLFIYFNGGPLAFESSFLKIMEPFFYKIANIKVVVMPYGSDVQLMSRSRNLHFKHVISIDYPKHHCRQSLIKKNINRWTRYADWVISGCEWVDYMYHWNTLLLGHFSIDLDQVKPLSSGGEPKENFRVFHAPNHVSVKGTSALMSAVDRLKKEGLDIELVIAKGVANSKIKELINTVDVVADQFVIGWYAMFAIEAMAMEKPVMCYLRQDLIEFYCQSGLVSKEEIPIINTPFLDIYEKLKWCYFNRDALSSVGRKSRVFAEKHHSLTTIGSVFSDILKNLDVMPSLQVGSHKY